MARGLTASGGDVAGGKLSTSAGDRARLIERRLRRTRGHVKWTELVTALLLFAAGALAYLFAFAVVDHWFVRGGVSFWGRLFFLAAFLTAGTVFLIRAVGPLLTRRINTLYAAATIERDQPALKNSLVNFLLLRSRPQDVNPAVFKAIERQAARDLKSINPEAVIDRTHLIHAGYVLMAVVAVCCVYTLLSSKSPFRSVGRMFVPWANVEAPTRVGFSDVRPGSRQAFHDEFIDVSALVQGIDDDEPVTLYYSTADGQSVDMPLDMTRPEGSFRYQVTLPEGSSGIQQDVEYYLVAGDARTHTYSIRVESAPAIIVDRVDFDYPDYTALANRGQRGQGDIVALEGTRITLSARANQTIKEAFIDFDCNGSRDLDMDVDGKLASVSFTLRLNENRSAGEFESYEIRFMNEQGHENPRPARHRIEVTPDAAPEIEITQPAVDEIEVPVNAAVEIELKARDRDFQLSNVTIHARRDGQVLLRRALLEDLHDGEFSGAYRLRPSDLGLKVGDEIVYWGDARDNKHPTANRTQTIEYRLRIVEPAEQPPQDEQQEDGQEERPDEQPGGEAEAEQTPMPEPDDQGAEEGAEEEASEEIAQDDSSEATERIDPEAQPGEAFEEILKRLEEQKPQQNGDQENPDEQAQDQDQPPSPEEEQPQEDGMGEQPQDAGDQGAEEQSPSQPSTEKSPSGEQQGEGGDQQAGEAPESSEGGEQGDSSSGGQQDSGGGESSDSPGGQQPSPDSSGGSSKQQSPGGDESQSGGDGEMKANDSSGSTEGSQSGGGQEGADQGQQSPAAKDGTPQRDRPGSSGDSERSDSGRADSETSGDGGQSAGSGNEGSQEKPNDSDKQSDPRGGNPEQQQGTDGAGEKGDQDAGTGSKEGHQKPKDKQQQTAPSDEDAAKDEASPPSESTRESDSQGGNSGERSGGGDEGAGQSADAEGTGSAGSNSASEEGAGQSEGTGKGPTSDQPGDKSASDSASDRPGEKTSGEGGAGKGGPSAEGTPQGSSGDSGSNDPMGGDSPPGEGSPQQSGDSQSSGTGAGGTPGGSKGDTPGQAAGKLPGDKDSGSAPSEDEQGADDPNLEYAREATDLALEYLRDQLQQDQPDQELLDRLQWTREDMQRFVKYWDQLKREATPSGDEASGDDLREALQGLGLRRKGTQIKGGQSAKDQFRQLRESRRTSPPPEYADQFRYFTEGTSRRATANGSND